MASTRCRILAAVLPLLALAIPDAAAACREFGGFPVFQCADNAFFAPLPAPVIFDPNGVPRNISSVFWQIGFGNGTFSAHPGPPPVPTVFPGNDSGYEPLNMRQASQATGQPLPAGSVCLVVDNWANPPVDGCCDDERNASIPYDKDSRLNPFEDVPLALNGFRGYYSLYAQQDYPMAVLLKGPATVFTCDRTPKCGTVAGAFCTTGPRAGQGCRFDIDCDFCSAGPHAGDRCGADSQCADTSAARYFALAAVATWDRNNDGSGQNGPCAATNPGTNPGPCTLPPGYYTFAKITNGDLNPLNGAHNVIPWQEAPAPQLTCVGDCSSTGPKTIDASWSPIVLYHDASIRPSTNPTLAPADPTRAAGVGVLDIDAKFPLLRYQLESAQVTCANVDGTGTIQPATMTWSSFGADTTATSLTGFTSSPDTCYRVRVLFGKKPETTSISQPVCALGKCGDIGYDASRVDPGAIDCVGGSVVQGPTGTANVCGCTPTTCAAQGKNCGTISDGCGGSLDCGACVSPQSCGGGGVPNVCGGPPTISVSVAPDLLWPPSHQMIAVHATVTATASVGTPTVALVSVTSSEPDDAPGGADGHTLNDIQDASVGTADFDFLLRAERDSTGSGRLYTVTYRAVDGSGNSATASAVVSVPHDLGGGADPIVISAAQTPSGTLISWNAVPGAQHYNVIRGRREQIQEVTDAISLGAVTCVAGRITDTSTTGFEDAEIPAPGRAFFYLTEYDDGMPSTYGAPDVSKPRVPGSGACP